MPLLAEPGIKQYAADDTSYAASKVRDFWKDRQKAAFEAQRTANQPTSTDQKPTTSADFSVLRNVKNPALENQNTSLLSDLKKSQQANETLFQKYLDEAKSEALRAKADLEKERATYDNSKFREDLAKARLEQEDALRNSQKSALDFAAGNVERRLLGSALPTGMSSQLQQSAVDEFARATLPYEERLAAGRQADLTLLRNLDLQTAPLARRAGSEYLSTLLTPVQARNALLNANIASTGALGELDRANTFYGLTKTYDDSRVPALLMPATTYQVPGTSRYAPPRSGYTPLPDTSSRFQFTSPAGTGERSVPPRQTPLNYPQFAEEDAYARSLPSAALKEGRAKAKAQADARAHADDLYWAQTGKDPNTDPFYNEELWRSLYNQALGI